MTELHSLNLGQQSNVRSVRIREVFSVRESGFTISHYSSECFPGGNGEGEWGKDYLT